MQQFYSFTAGTTSSVLCPGDSGGPMYLLTAYGEFLAGITSRGYTCGKGGFYAVPQGGLCWLNGASGLDLRPPDCEDCDCINTDPNRDQGCGCTSGPGGPLALLLPLALLALRPRRRPVPAAR